MEMSTGLEKSVTITVHLHGIGYMRREYITRGHSIRVVFSQIYDMTQPTELPRIGTLIFAVFLKGILSLATCIH